MIRSATEWLTRTGAKFATMCMLFAGIALLAAGFASGSAVPVQAATAFLFAGGAAQYVLGTRRPLPFETQTAPADRASIEPWSLFAALALVLIALWVFARVQPAVTLWQDMLATVDNLDLWPSMQQRPEMSGLVFAPVAAALAVPALQAMSVAALVVGSIGALILLIARSSWFARVLLACTLLQGAMVFASASATTLADRAVVSVNDAIRETSARDPVIASRALEQVQRYKEVMIATTGTLIWAWAASGVLTSLVFVLGGISAPAATAVQPIAPIDHQAANPAEREQYFADVARRLSRRTRF